MAGTNETITLTILAKDLASGNIGGFIGKLDQLAKKGGLAGSVAQGVGLSLGTMINPLALVTKGIGFVTGAIGDSLTAFREAEKVQAQTTAVLNSTGQAAHLTGDEVSALATKISAYSGIDDEAIQSAENLLLTFTKVRNEVGEGNDIFSQATATIEDMSVALGTDASASAIQLGKALNDPIKGMTALRKVGVSFTAEQIAQVTAMVKANDLLGAQKLILGELQTEFGGSALAAGNTADGMNNKLSVAVENLEEKIGQGLMPVVSELTRELSDVMGVATPLSGEIGKLTDKLDAQVDALKAHKLAAQDVTDTVVGGGDHGFLGFLALAEHLNDLGGQFGVSGAIAAQWANQLQDASDAAGLTQDAVEHLIADDRALGMSFDDVKAQLEGLIPPLGQARADADLFGKTSLSTATKVVQSADDIAKAEEEMAKSIEKNMAAAGAAIAALAPINKDTLKSMKQDAKASLHDYLWNMNHATDIARAAAKVETEMSNKQLQKGLARHEALAEATMADLIVKLAQLRGQAISAGEALQWVLGMGPIPGIGVEWLTGPRNKNHHGGGSGSGKGGGRASGGPVGGAAGSVFTVGENGPETLVMGGGATGNVRPGTGHTFVYAPQFSTASEAEARAFAAKIGPYVTRWQQR